ncbi:MAG: UvrB/UvrC motif-containing protein [Puniceicoccales bacterium]|jgi:protein arginine kinase activator|nr:UvrB/UvrC motif-containing protein [Puniceicoccales bacterium]
MCDERVAVFITFVTNTTIQKTGYCLAHAQQKGFLEATSFGFLDQETGLEVHSIAPANACPHCQCTQEAFIQNKRWGCPECYRTFSSTISALLERMCEDPVYRGKIPQNLRSRDTFVETRLRTLQTEMRRALEAEDYELATQIRDKIDEEKKGRECSS